MHKLWVHCRACGRLDFYGYEWPCQWCGGTVDAAGSAIGSTQRHIGVMQKGSERNESIRVQRRL